MGLGLWGYLTALTLVLALAFASVAAVFVKQLGDRVPPPLNEEVGSAKAVVRKVRKREPMSKEELDYANHLLGARSSLMAFCIPGTLLMVGCFYVFGSLYHLHGATPSERTFLGVFPILAAINFTTQILRSVRLNRRLQKMS